MIQMMALRLQISVTHPLLDCSTLKLIGLSNVLALYAASLYCVRVYLIHEYLTFSVTCISAAL